MVTIKDVAREANVSTMTVSRAFKEDSSMKKETREKILAIAKRLNYVPNFSAKSLVTNRKFSIGLFFSSVTIGTSQIFLGELVKKVYSLLPENYLLSVNSIDKTFAMGQSILGRFDGIIIATQSAQDDEFIKRMQESDLPIVVMNRELADTELFNVASSDKQGIQELAAYLQQMGTKTVGTISGLVGFTSTEERHDSFLTASQELGMELLGEADERGDYSIESGYQAMQRMIEKKITLPDAVFCANDDMAIGAVKACVDHELNVPEDISIVGFDDTNYVKYMVPALTTVHKPYQEMAELAMKLLLELIDGNEPQLKKYLLPSNLVIRDSVKNHLI